MRRASRRFDYGLKRWLALFSLFVVITFCLSAHGQQTSTTKQAQTEAHRIHALRITDSIKIDGQLDESAWTTAEPATDFRQESPTEGAPASEKTEVRVLYDDKNIYISIRAFDSEPKNINARELVRDADFANDDTIAVVLDTYHDRRNAFRFTVNPLGTQRRPNSDFFIIYNQSTGAGLERPSYSLQFKLTRDFTF
jgi:hypothetical protein